MTIAPDRESRLFETIYKNVLSALGMPGVTRFGSTLKAYVTYRTLIIFKLDLMLYDYKEKNDPFRFTLRGRAALNSFLFNYKGIPFDKTATLTLHEVLTLLAPEIQTYQIPNDVMQLLKKKPEFSFEPFERSFSASQPDFFGTEWDPELLDRQYR